MAEAVVLENQFMRLVVQPQQGARVVSLIDKRSGRVSYAVLSFGGFLGLGHEHYPLPWGKLNYDEGLGGYRVDVSKEQVENAPHYESDAEYEWNRRNGKMIHDYYGVPPYWM